MLGKALERLLLCYVFDVFLARAEIFCFHIDKRKYSSHTAKRVCVFVCLKCGSSSAKLKDKEQKHEHAAVECAQFHGFESLVELLSYWRVMMHVKTWLLFYVDAALLKRCAILSLCVCVCVSVCLHAGVQLSVFLAEFDNNCNLCYNLNQKVSSYRVQCLGLTNMFGFKKTV